jgi:hypothetical protein
MSDMAGEASITGNVAVLVIVAGAWVGKMDVGKGWNGVGGSNGV